MSVIDGQLAAGFGLALGAAACYDTGYALQAVDARRASPHLALRPSLLGYLLRQPLWVGATALSLVGWPLQILALEHAPLTLVQPTLALGLVLLLALGARILGEPVGRREVAAVLVIIAAVGVIAWAAPQERGTVARGAGLTVALAALAGVAVSPYLARAVRKKPPTALLIVAAGAADGLAAFVAKLIAEHASAGEWISAAAWAALVAAVVVIGLISEATALQRAAATRVAPAVLVLQIVIPVVLAPIIGGEGWAGTPLGGAVLVGALAGVAAGVALLGTSPAVAGVISREPEHS